MQIDTTTDDDDTVNRLRLSDGFRQRLPGSWLSMFAVLSGLAGCQVHGGDPHAGIQRRLVAESGGLYRDADVSRALAAIGERLSAVSGGMTVSVEVLNASVPNAYFLPGGHIYLTRQLLAMTDDESEIAAVIAHEMAHILLDHAQQREALRMQTAVSSDRIAEILPDSAGVRVLLSQGRAEVAALSRRQELEADALAIRMLAEAGYDPAAAERFLKKMAANDVANDTGGQFSYLSAHPLPAERIAQARRLAGLYPDRGTGAAAGKPETLSAKNDALTQ